MADFFPDFDFVEEEFDFAEFDGRPYLFEPEYNVYLVWISSMK